MNKNDSKNGVTNPEVRIEQAEARAIQAEARTVEAKTRTEQAETRTEQAETRAEQAKTRTEQAETRAEQAETRAEQVETVLERVIEKVGSLDAESSTALLKPAAKSDDAGPKSPVELLTDRQREILRLIAEGQNTKSIADLLGVSPKTVEYHRMKLMAELDLHDIPSLVRYAMKVGLIPPEF